MQGGWRGRGSRARLTEPGDTYTVAVIEEALLAAAAVSERVYEVAPDIPAGMEGAFPDLAEAVFRWTEGRDFQQELADEGARAGAVADLADPTYAASCAVTVHPRRADQRQRRRISSRHSGK
jgi:hypothetical protein